MKKTAFIIMIITVFSKIFGFVRQITLSFTFGASASTDVYLVSQSVPNVIFSFIGVGIATSFIPLYSRLLNDNGKNKADEFASNLSNITLLITTIIVAIILIFTRPIVRLFALGFSNETLQLAVNFTRITVFGAYFGLLADIFVAYLQIHGNYIVPALVGFPSNLVIIATLLMGVKFNIYIIAVGVVLASASKLLFLLPFVRKNAYRHKMILTLGDETIRMMFFLAIPVIAGTSVEEINIIVDRTLASSLATGGIASLHYARRLYGFVTGLFVTPIIMVLYPTISEMAANNNMKGLKASLSEAISVVNLLVVPASVGAMVLSKEVVSFLFGRGAFTPQAIDMTASALVYYSIGMVAFGLREIFSRAFYALQDTKTPMINAAIGVAVNIVLNIILSKYLNIGGLALATSLAGIITALLMFVTLRKKIGGFGFKAITISFIKITFASMLMAFIASASFNILKQTLGESISLVLAIVMGTITYMVSIFFLRIPEVRRITRKALLRFNVESRVKD